MDLFNIGGGELLILALLALILFGPEDIIKIARTAGKYIRDAQQMWGQVVKSLQQDILDQELKETLQETQTTIGEVKKTLSMDSLTKTLSASFDEPAPKTATTPPQDGEEPNAP